MQNYIAVSWSDSSRTLSGNPEVENLIARCRLSAGHYWFVVVNADGHWFAGNKKIKLRDNGKGQTSLGGLTGIPCELVRGKNSSGEKVEFVEAIERRKIQPKGDRLYLPMAFHVDDESSWLAYKRKGGMNPTPETWAKKFQWMKPGRLMEGLAAATKFHEFMIATSETEKWRLKDELIDMGVKGLFTLGKKPPVAAEEPEIWLE